MRFSEHEQAQIRRLRIALRIDDPKESQEVADVPMATIVAS